MHSLIWARIASLFILSTFALAQNSPISQVDPFIGTQASPQVPHDIGTRTPAQCGLSGCSFGAPTPSTAGFTAMKTRSRADSV